MGLFTKKREQAKEVQPIPGKLNAKVILARCKKSKQLFGITIEQVNRTRWNMKYSYFIDEKRAKSEGFDQTVISADCYSADTYPGCPNCKSMGYVKCEYCGKLTCWDGERSLRCAWCGKLLNDIAYRGAMDLLYLLK